MLEIKNLTKSFDKDIIKDFSLKVENKIISFIGKSGCGKSTILKCIVGIITDYKGEILIDSKDILKNDIPISYISQDSKLLPWLTVLDNIVFPFKNAKNKNVIINKALKLLKELNLIEYKDKLPKALSGGLEKRMLFIRALIQNRYYSNNKIMLLDEIFNSLDSITKEKLYFFFLSLNKHYNSTTIIVSHDIEEALILSDRILVLSSEPCFIIKEFDLNYKNELENIEDLNEFLIKIEDYKNELIEYKKEIKNLLLVN